MFRDYFKVGAIILVIILGIYGWSVIGYYFASKKRGGRQ